MKVRAVSGTREKASGQVGSSISVTSAGGERSPRREVPRAADGWTACWLQGLQREVSSGAGAAPVTGTGVGRFELSTGSTAKIGGESGTTWGTTEVTIERIVSGRGGGSGV